MKALFWFGLVCVVLGLWALLMQVPRQGKPSFQSGSVSMSVSRTHPGQVPRIVGSVLIIGGLGMMITGCRERRC